ncbi:EspA/EspE family type VII secretion system effector [Mycolicibacterium llatzerense]|uniref:EspA/EspE family type VII secretion system effector n=1 Tax=Mycolicibacterium llatzerense TaxID=280871 RepID=UPI0006967B19|nr:EspA/EspE family type VII secretion system effector [Mycolicibacterium llatzerense]
MFGGLTDFLTDVGRGAATVVSGVDHVVDEAGHAFAEGVETYTHTLGEVGESVLDGGENLVEGLVDGVKGIVGAELGLLGDVNTAIMDGVMAVGGLVADAADMAGKLFQMASFETPIIARGLQDLDKMSKQLGTGAPENGESFTKGATELNSGATALGQAVPGDSWSGSGADAYSTKNKTQIAQTNAVAKTDSAVAKILAREAQQLATARKQLNAISTMLSLAIPGAVMSLHMGDLVGWQVKQITAVNLAMAAAGQVMSTMTAHAATNAAEMTTAASGYQTVATATTAQTPTPPTPPPGNTPGTTPGSTPSGNPGTGGNQGGGGGNSGGGGGSSGGGGSPSAPTMPEMPSTTGASGGSGGGSPTGGMPSSGGSPSGGGGSPSGGGGSGAGSGLGSLGQLIGQAIQAAQEKKDDKTKEGEEGPADEKDKDGKDKEGEADKPGEESKDPTAAPEGAAAADGAAGRAPIHVSVDDGVRRVEFDVQPEQAQGTVHVSLDPANLAAPPRITTET